jgi:hypothetical protein
MTASLTSGSSLTADAVVTGLLEFWGVVDI